MSDWIDPLRVPFTIDEMRSALHRWRPAEEAEERLAWMVEEAAMDRERDASPDDGECTLDEELLACLRLVSPSAAERVDRIMAARWSDARRSALMHEQFAAAVRSGVWPSHDDVMERELRMLERGATGTEEERASSSERDAASPAPPPAPLPVTPEIIAAAEARVARRRTQWEALCEAAAQGTLPEPEPNELMEAWHVGALPDAGGAPDWARIDGYLAHAAQMYRHGQDRDVDGAEFRRLFGRFVRERDAANAAIVHALGVAPREALPRLVMHAAGGTFSGALPLVEQMGAAAWDAFAASGLPAPALVPFGPEGEAYAAIDLWTWLATHRAVLDVPPVVEAWRTARRTDLNARMAIQLRRMERGEAPMPEGWIRATEGEEG